MEIQTHIALEHNVFLGSYSQLTSITEGPNNKYSRPLMQEVCLQDQGIQCGGGGVGSGSGVMQDWG